MVSSISDNTCSIDYIAIRAHVRGKAKRATRPRDSRMQADGLGMQLEQRGYVAMGGEDRESIRGKSTPLGSTRVASLETSMVVE